MKRFHLLWVAPPVLLFVAFLAPVIVGSETFFLRDVMSVHAGLRAGLDAADGTMPLVDPLRGGGQPAAGNPNVVALHPSALLHRVLPFFAAFDAHLWLHLLAAPFALFWLARELGLGRRGAWAAAVVWGFSGFVLSQAAFFNVVAAVATAPALAAAAVGSARRLAEGRGAGRHLAATGVLTALVLVAGDPVTAAAALVAAAALAVAEAWQAGERRPAALGWTTAALACGALLALPQIVELLRVLPASARGAGYGEAMRTAGSWDPRQAIEQLLPLAFGRPDLLASDQQAGSFWGHRFHQGSWSFHFSLYPGLAAFALAAAAGRAWRLPGALGRVGRRGWLLVAAGLFFALGAFNPLVSALLALPGLDAARFPVKLWLWVAMGLALIAGVGLERLPGDDARDARRRALATLGGFAALFALLALLCTLASGAAARALQAMMPPGVPLDFAAAEAARWAGLATLSAAAALLLAAAVYLSGRRPALGGALLVFVAAALQLVMLRPLLATEPTAIYRQPPPVLAALPADARIAHGTAGALFGPDPPDEGLPAPEVRWVFRRTHGEAYPHAGALFGRRYDLHATPEGLDSAGLQRAIAAVQAAPDDQVRVRLLQTWGIDRLVLGRELGSDLADLVWRQESYGRALRVYRIESAGSEVVLATHRVHLRPGAPPEAAVAVMSDPRFVPGAAVVVEAAGRPPPPATGARHGWRLADGGERLVAATRATGSTVLVWQRAWLPCYRAEIDGEPAEVKQVNLYRIGVEVPSGEHEVAVWVDRGPTRWGWAGAAMGAALLAWLAWSGSGRRRRQAPPLPG